MEENFVQSSSLLHIEEFFCNRACAVYNTGYIKEHEFNGSARPINFLIKVLKPIKFIKKAGYFGIAVTINKT